jgi:ABC-type transport auxiliary lipoprotein component
MLHITPPRAAAGYDWPGIAYRRSPTRLDYYAASEWADDPARLIEPLIIAAAEASGGFEAVVSAGTGLTAETRLDTEIVRIEHELLAAPRRDRLTLRAQLVDVWPAGGSSEHSASTPPFRAGATTPRAPSRPSIPLWRGSWSKLSPSV